MILNFEFLLSRLNEFKVLLVCKIAVGTVSVIAVLCAFVVVTVCLQCILPLN